MLFKIEHLTTYRYSKPVFSEPQHFYFYPRLGPNIRLVSFDLQVSPIPTGLSSRIDIENNVFHQCWFNNTLDNIKITTKIEVETIAFNYLDFLVEENSKVDGQDSFQIYLINNLSKEIKVWTNNIFTDSPNIVSFLSNITDQIKSNWDHVSRYESDLMEPELCFQTKSGSCRDLSWMMIQMLRSQSIPARFVSGYSYNPELVGHELHAWVEVWVNGAGWVAVDPSSGLFVDDSYVPIASSHHPSNTNPVHGKFRGDAIAELETTVNIHTS